MAEWSPKIRRVSSGEDKAKLAFVNSLLSERRFEEAEAEAEKLLAANERTFGAHLAKGRALQGQKKFEESLAHFKRATEIDPMQASAHLMAGMSAYFCSNFDFAAEKFQTAVDIDPKSSPGYLGLAQLQYRRSDVENAKINVDKALAYNPNLAPAMLLRARLLAKSGDTRGATGQLTSLVDANPGNRPALISLAAAHLQEENYPEAEKVLVSALDGRADDAIVNGLLGRARLKLGDYAGAEAAIRASMKNQPKMQNIGRSLQLAEALIGQKKLEEARALLEAAPKFGPLAAIVNARLGDLHFADGTYQQATANYRAALLQSAEGEDIVRRIDAEVASHANSADSAWRAGRYRQAAEERQQAARKSFAEQDWQALLDKYRPVIAQLMESWRGAED